jgi:hypothetical protein
MVDSKYGLFKWWTTAKAWTSSHSVAIVFLLAVLMSGVGAVAGDANIPWPWLFLLAATIAAVAGAITHAIQASTSQQRVRSLSIALTCALAIPIGAFTYHELFDSVSSEGAERLVDAPEGVPVQLYTEPQGEQTYQFGIVLGGGRVQIACVIRLKDGGEWYAVMGRGGYLPGNLLRTPNGRRSGEVSEC